MVRSLGRSRLHASVRVLAANETARVGAAKPEAAGGVPWAEAATTSTPAGTGVPDALGVTDGVAVMAVPSFWPGSLVAGADAVVTMRWSFPPHNEASCALS